MGSPLAPTMIPAVQRRDVDQACVLLVDDDPAVRTSFERACRRLGFDVEVAVDGREALERVDARHFDLILADVAMPGLGGVDLLRAIRATDIHIPVALMTAAPELDTAMEAVEYGAFRYLVKPVEIDELARTLERAVAAPRVARPPRATTLTPENPILKLVNSKSLEHRFQRALEGLWIAFQPIVSWSDKRVLAYEALVRSDEPSLSSPLGLLDAAQRLDRTDELGRKIRSSVADVAPFAPDGVLLYVNVNATDLNDEQLLDPSAPLSQIADRVVLEITERMALDEVVDLETRRRRLAGMGFRIAVDDLGAGYAGLSSFETLQPDVVKLDMSLIRDVNTCPRKRCVVGSMISLCSSQLGAQVVCEGVETMAELDTLVELGADAFQGYLFAKPGRGFPTPKL